MGFFIFCRLILWGGRNRTQQCQLLMTLFGRNIIKAWSPNHSLKPPQCFLPKVLAAARLRLPASLRTPRRLAIGSGRKGSVGRDPGGDQWRAAPGIGPGTRWFYWLREPVRSTLFSSWTRWEGVVGDQSAGGVCCALVCGERAAEFGCPGPGNWGVAPTPRGAVATSTPPP